MQKNVASQKWVVFAFDETDNTAKIGDAANITAEISKDGAAGGGNITDTNPTELEDGYYVFDIAQGESNADLLLLLPESSTGDIQVIGCPAAVYTTEPNRNKLSVDSNGRVDVIKVAGTTQTANDGQADINTILSRVTGNVALASVVGALADAAAAGEVTEADTLMQYLKQLINILIGAAGIGAFPAAAAPANAVSLAEVIRDIQEDTTAIQAKLPANKFMGSSDGADDDGVLDTINTNAARLTAARAAVLTDLIDGGRLDLLIDAIKVVTDWQRSVSGTVVVVDPGTDKIFDLTAVLGTLSTENDAYVNMQITIFDNSGSVLQTRKISTFVGASGRATLDESITFPVQDGVDTFILWNKYSPTAAAGGGATAQEVHEYDVSGIITEGQAGYEIQQRGGSSIYH